ncbi:MAG: Sjogren's syndrome/scleroderma autoantigen 1 protein [Cenarchaeum symbiont of Oopsacas minuta]|nr:Sjogren's syndrome/scleroderma autoantigen 1 protein [Cenarchaeum symbiont of Oopsacas minuta]
MTDLSKRAAKMLLQGATLLAQPCPYCKGVRVMKNGNALCTDCGREPKNTKQLDAEIKTPLLEKSNLERLEKKLNNLTTELEDADSKDRKEILESIDMLSNIISKLRK